MSRTARCHRCHCEWMSNVGPNTVEASLCKGAEFSVYRGGESIDRPQPEVPTGVAYEPLLRSGPRSLSSPRCQRMSVVWFDHGATATYHADESNGVHRFKTVVGRTKSNGRSFAPCRTILFIFTVNVSMLPETWHAIMHSRSSRLCSGKPRLYAAGAGSDRAGRKRRRCLPRIWRLQSISSTLRVESGKRAIGQPAPLTTRGNLALGIIVQRASMDMTRLPVQGFRTN